MLSFHGKQEVKDFYLARVRAHQLADRLIQGTGWEKDGELFRGCAVGCTLENYDHSRYPIELGLPEWIAHLEDRIFENLPQDEAMLWPEKFLNAISIGVDVDNVRHKLAILRLNRLIELQNKNKELQPQLANIFDQTIAAIEIVKQCHEAELNKSYCDWSAARSAAWSAAWSAAESARSARSARSAAESAESAAESAESAAESAESAAESAESAAESAESAAESARSAAWKQEADDLLRLLSECKPEGAEK